MLNPSTNYSYNYSNPSDNVFPISSDSSSISFSKNKSHQIASNYFQALKEQPMVSHRALPKPSLQDVKGEEKFDLFENLKIAEDQWIGIERVNNKIRMKSPQKEGTEREKIFNSRNILYVFWNVEKNKYLIGKTDRTLKERCREYFANAVNLEPSKRSEFLEDLNKHPEQIKVALFYVKDEKENLEELERLAIQAKKRTAEEDKWELYNERGGGGGGRSHPLDQNLNFLVPKNINDYTPIKYHLYAGREGKIRIKRRIEWSQEETAVNQLFQDTFVYCIRNKEDPKKRLVGITSNPIKRATQHAYKAEEFYPKSKKYRTDKPQTGALLYREMGKNPDQYEFGIYPVYKQNEISPSKLDNFHVFQHADEIEKHVTLAKKALVKQGEGGLNQKLGGGSYPVKQKPKST